LIIRKTKPDSSIKPVLWPFKSLRKLSQLDFIRGCLAALAALAAAGRINTLLACAVFKEEATPFCQRGFLANTNLSTSNQKRFFISSTILLVKHVM
jgi:hypothetical protein